MIEVNLENKALPDKLVIIGAGGHAAVILDMIEQIQITYRFAVKVEFLDDNIPPETRIYGRAVLGKINKCIEFPHNTGFVIGIGDNEVRRDIAAKYSLNFVTLVHPKAVIGSSVKMGEGAVVMAGAVINCNTQIGSHCIINTGATIDHECQIDDYVHISPGAHLGGRVSIRERSWIGIGSCVKNNVTVGRKCIIGAGGVVINDLPDNCTAVGNPAKPMKSQGVGVTR